MSKVLKIILSMVLVGALLVFILPYLGFAGILAIPVFGNMRMERAIKNNDPSLCKGVKGYDSNPNPFMCYLRVATENQNPESCELAAKELSEQAGDDCFQDLVYKINYLDHDKRVRVCNMIQNERKQEQCLEGVKKVEENPGDYRY